VDREPSLSVHFFARIWYRDESHGSMGGVIWVDLQ
jgi:hypothetical protein